jgi:REP element-mobilizing transposase RayT
MKLQVYQPHELRFAYCYRVYLRWRTRRGIHQPHLAELKRRELNDLVRVYEIRVLECTSNETDLLCIVSLLPSETISGCASKLKGRVSKWLRERLQLTQPVDLLSKGYFGCTIGKSSSRTVERYLSTQAEHHGYERRRLPPIFVEQYQLSDTDKSRVSARHAAVIAQFHVVLSTNKRRGILGSNQGRKITAEWRKLQNTLRIAFIKVSFVPDHVHIAFRSHPAVSPADVAVALMNSAQELVHQEMIQVGLERLWQPSAYIGSYGDLASAQVRKYMENWRPD